MEAPKYLLQKKLLLESVLFIVSFSILFMSIYKPFSATVWFGLFPLSKLFTTTFFYFVAVAILIVSKYILYIYQTKYRLSITVYSLWIMVEFIMIAILYLFFTETFGMSGNRISLIILLKTSLCVGLILVIPYTIITLYAGSKAKTEELNILKLQNTLQSVSHEPHLVNLYDYNNSMKISIHENSIFYIESQDNYVQIFYELNGKMQSYLLRVRTQKLEEQLMQTSLIRCHRSFIINVNKIKIFKDERNHATIMMMKPSTKSIPVSKSYYKSVSEIISKKDELQNNLS